jgi:hypothetical protein
LAPVVGIDAVAEVELNKTRKPGGLVEDLADGAELIRTRMLNVD